MDWARPAARNSGPRFAYHPPVTKTRAIGLAGSLALVVTLFVVLPGLGADEKSDGRDRLYRPLGLFTEVLSLVRSNYVEPVEMKPLLSGAFSGMTEAMDPFAEYIPPDKMAAYQAAMASHEKKDVVDVGLVLAKRLGYPLVVAAIAGGPAAVAGMKADDVIEKIDDKPVHGLSLWEAEARLSGPPGSKVRVLLVREGKPRRRTIEIARAGWTPESPWATRVEGETLITVPTFGPGTAEALRKILGPLDRTKPLLLDLRSNAIGSFEEAARAAALFLPPATLGELKGRKIETRVFKSEPGERIHNSRLVLLVDSGTAGPAELFTAALRDVSATEAGLKPNGDSREGAPEGEEAPDRNKAKRLVRLVGEPTFGMAFKAQVVKLASGGALKISVGKVHSPSGKALSPRGLEPDERVYQLPDDGTSRPTADPILQRGLKVMAEATAPKSAA